MKIVTLKDLKGNNDQDDSDENKERYFAGGGKNTGTMMEGDDERKQFVQNAPKPAQKLLEKALANQKQLSEGEEDSNEDNTPSPSTTQPTFQGASYTLTGKSSNKSPSSKKKDDKEKGESDEVVRTVVLYNNGFMISGPGMEDSFKDYSDEQNTRLLDQITEGRVPLREMSVKPFQKVLLKIDYKQGVEYKPAKPSTTQFVGASQRLDQEQKGEKKQPSSSTASAPQPLHPEFPCNPNKPTTALQIRCKNGTRISMRVNHDTTLDEILHYVSACIGIKTDDCILISMTNPTLSDKNNRTKTVAELDILNSVLTQK